MAEQLLITRRRNIAGLYLDATVEEQYTSVSTVTLNPVEFGASITDHRIRQPEKYTVAGRVSDIAIRELTPDPWKNGDAETRSKAAWAILNALKNDGEPFAIESGLQRYENMVIETLTAKQAAVNANSLDFVAQCVQVIIVDSEETIVNFPEAGEVEEQTSNEVDRGDVQADTPDSENEVQRSWLLQLLQIVGAEDGS